MEIGRWKSEYERTRTYNIIWNKKSVAAIDLQVAISNLFKPDEMWVNFLPLGTSRTHKCLPAARWCLRLQYPLNHLLLHLQPNCLLPHPFPGHQRWLQPMQWPPELPTILIQALHWLRLIQIVKNGPSGLCHVSRHLNRCVKVLSGNRRSATG